MLKSNLWDMLKNNLLAAQLLFMTTFIFLTLNYSSFPGANSDYPLGYFGWYDQGNYLSQLKNLIINGLSGLSSGVYPPGYMVLATPIALILLYFTDSYAEYAIIITNTMLVIGAIIIFAHSMKQTKAISFLITFTILIILSDLVRNSLIIPWSTSLSLFVASLLYYIISRENILFEKKISRVMIFISYGIMLSILFHSRPQDFIIISFSSTIYLVFSFLKNKHIGRNVYFAITSFLILEIIFYLSAGGLAFGDNYNLHHVFTLGGNFDKLLGIISGDQTYGILSESLIERGVVPAIIILTIFIAGIIFGKIEMKAAIFLWLIIYLSFSDFGPHNFTRYELFHYFKTPFIICTAIFVTSVTYYKILLLCSLTFLTLLLNTNIVFKNILYGTGELNGKNMVFQISTNSNIDGIFLSGVKPMSVSDYTLSIFFEPPSVTINNVKLKAFKEYRVFEGKNGIYIHFFYDQPLSYRLGINAKNLELIPNTKINIFSFERRLGVK